MNLAHILKISFKLSLFVFFYIVSLFLFACSPSVLTLPKDAREALIAYWDSLPSESGIEHHIVRAWPGSIDTENLMPQTPEMEVWCVEAVMSSSKDPSINEEKLTWIVMREDKTVPWTAILLAAMSSTWPYEACGQAL